MGIRIAGTGSYLPGPPLDQSRVRAFLRRYPDGLSEAEQERLLQETGITTRHLAVDTESGAPRESNTSMAAEAGRRALAMAGWKPSDVELLVVTTVVPDRLMPPTSTLVQEALEIPRCAELEISANCTAPTKGIMVALNQLRLGDCTRALVCSSHYVSFLGLPPWSNPAHMRPNQGHLRWVLSDGAAALALERADPDTGLRTWQESVGTGMRSGMSLAFGAVEPDFAAAFARGDQHVTQDPLYVLRQAIPLATTGFERMLGELGISADQIDHFIPSVSSMQIATRLQRRLAERLGLRPEAWRMNFTDVGYVGSVAVPLILDEMNRAGTLRPGDLVCAVAEESSKWMCAGLALRWNP
jgi:3-oxoacyl-[acyl-carrier-protein] synthase-3